MTIEHSLAEGLDFRQTARPREVPPSWEGLPVDEDMTSTSFWYSVMLLRRVMPGRGVFRSAAETRCALPKASTSSERADARHPIEIVDGRSSTWRPRQRIVQLVELRKQ